MSTGSSYLAHAVRCPGEDFVSKVACAGVRMHTPEQVPSSNLTTLRDPQHPVAHYLPVSVLPDTNVAGLVSVRHIDIHLQAGGRNDVVNTVRDIAPSEQVAHRPEVGFAAVGAGPIFGNTSHVVSYGHDSQQQVFVPAEGNFHSK